MAITERLEDSKGNWVRQSFMIPRTRARLQDQRDQLFADVDVKFTDSSLGGNYYINPVPQFCEYTDLARVGRNPHNFSTEAAYNGDGMSRYYSEAFDDPAQIVYFRFGMPAYTPLTTFWTGFYDADASRLARRGRSDSLAFTAGRIIGTVLSLPLAPLIAVGTAWKFITRTPASKYYYLDPKMPLYWNAVNNIYNTIIANKGVYPRVNVFGTDESTDVYKKGNNDAGVSFTEQVAAKLAEISPDIYYKNGGVDVYAVANKATRLAHQEIMAFNNAIDTATTPEDFAKRIQDYYAAPVKSASGRSLDQYLQEYAASAFGAKDGPPGGDSGTNITEEQNGRPRLEQDPDSGVLTRVQGWLDSVIGSNGYLDAELADGSAFLGLKVNYTGSSQESFSNSTRRPDIANTVNNMSQQRRMQQISLSGGNIASGGLGGLLQSAIGTLGDVASGIAEGLEISGAAALFGAAYVDIPDVWDDAVYNATTTDYKIELRSPYGNKLSQCNNLWFPVACILAGVLPLSAGQHAYVSPFICELYSKGRAQKRLAIIDRVVIERGVGNLGFNLAQEPLGIDVTISVKTLSNICHMPISNAYWPNPLRGVMSEDSEFNDLLAVYGSLGISDQIYFTRRLELNLTKTYLGFRTWTSPARFASWANGTLPGRIANAIARETDRPN